METRLPIAKRLDKVSLPHEDIFKEEARTEYQEYINIFFLRVAELNSNIYILEHVLTFPYELFAEGRTDDGFFFPLLIKNMFEACILLLIKVASDQEKDVYTLPHLKNDLLEMVKPQYHSVIKKKLANLRFDKQAKHLFEKARKLRNTQIAHFTQRIPQEQMTLLELKTLRDVLNDLLQGLSFEAELFMLPFSYEEGKSDVEWVLDCIAKSSDLLTLPEKDPDCWQSRRWSLLTLISFNLTIIVRNLVYQKHRTLLKKMGK